MSRKPPTEIDRLRLFVDLAEHYFGACDELPLERGVRISFNEAVPLALEVRLMLLRKFFERERQQDGNVHLRRIARTFGDCFTGSSPVLGQNLALYAADFNSILEGKTGIVVNDRQDSNGEVLYDALYGGLMHADWEKWETHKKRAGFVSRSTLTHVWEGLDHLVREAHLSVTTAFEAGHLHEPVR